MTGDGEPAKVLVPFLQRADELQKHDHLVSYYCRLYAMEKGLMIPSKERTKDTNSLLISLMNQLEKDKKVVTLSPDDSMHVEGFALGVFAKADKQDRAGRADLNTAKTFYAASIFFEVLLQFGELQPDIQEKQKYASWKAGDIRKAISEGRKPVPGPPGGEKDASEGRDGSSWNIEDSPPMKGSANSPEGPSSNSPPTGNRDGSLRPTSMDPNSASFPSMSSQPSEHQSHHTYSKSSEEYSLPSAPSNPIPPTYGQNPYASSDNSGYPSSTPGSQPQSSHPPSLYHHSSSTPFDSLGSSDSTPTVGSYSYASDQPGYSASAPSNYSSYVSSTPQDSHGGSQPSPSNYHQPQQGWPSSPFNEPSSMYPSVFPTAAPGYQPPALQYPTKPQLPHSNSGYPEPPASHVRTPSAPGAPELAGGYQMNGTYDSNYEPPPAQVAEAHKASRFAVSALAFDDIPTAISYLRKSLELLTSPDVSVKPI